MREKPESRKKPKPNGVRKTAVKLDPTIENRRLKREVTDLQRECQFLRKAILKMIPISVPVDDKSLTRMMAEPTIEMGAFLKQLRTNGK